MRSSTHSFRRYVVWFLAALLCPVIVSEVYAIADTSAAAGRTRTRVRSARSAELQSIKFVGTNEVSPDQLLGVMNSRESSLSFTRQLSRYYRENLERNPATPDVILNRLHLIERETARELRYFDKKMAEEDRQSILTYLSQNGYHNAAASFTFGYDSSANANTLTFTIIEGQRAVIDSIVFVGLDNVDSTIRQQALGLAGVSKGDPYVESSIESSAIAMATLLRNNGYYKARHSRIAVGRSDDGLSDSIVVVFQPGNRVKVSQIVFLEQVNGQPSVNESTRARQLEFSVGDWYSERNISQSKTNLLLLGTFDIVSIDTIPSSDTLSPKHPDAVTDSSLVLRVTTKNSKVYDVGASIIWYQTAIDNYMNLGVGTTALYRNLFGSAQSASLSLQYILQDISRAFQGQTLEREALATFALSWPSIFRSGGISGGLQSMLYYSNRTLVRPFRLESSGLTLKVPITLYSYTFFNSLEGTFGVDRQIPLNFEDAVESALAEAITEQDSVEVLNTFTTFTALDRYLSAKQNFFNFFTGIYLGATIRGEHRDNPLNPKRGTFTSLSSEWGWGAGKFIRTQFFNVILVPLTPTTVFASKINIGHIFLLNYQPNDTLNPGVYVPLERQFFAGGASSIRSFASRLLHDPVSGRTPSEREDPSKIPLYSNILGSASLFELSFELRFSFARPRTADGLWKTLVESSGFVAFVDYGNTFNRLSPGLYGKAQLASIIQGSVAALGFGYRFDTPVGPFRLDLATSVYNPLHPTNAWIVGRPNVMGSDNLQLSIGLGHAF